MKAERVAELLKVDVVYEPAFDRPCAVLLP
jgi:hypothetical protein